jgi:hypothetical protein
MITVPGSKVVDCERNETVFLTLNICLLCLFSYTVIRKSKDFLPRAAVLYNVSIKHRSQRYHLRIWNFCSGDQYWAEWVGIIETFRETPLGDHSLPLSKGHLTESRKRHEITGMNNILTSFAPV